jgi:hypothetical protein
VDGIPNHKPPSPHALCPEWNVSLDLQQCDCFFVFRVRRSTPSIQEHDTCLLYHKQVWHAPCLNDETGSRLASTKCLISTLHVPTCTVDRPSQQHVRKRDRRDSQTRGGRNLSCFDANWAAAAPPSWTSLLNAARKHDQEESCFSQVQAHFQHFSRQISLYGQAVKNKQDDPSSKNHLTKELIVETASCRTSIRNCLSVLPIQRLVRLCKIKPFWNPTGTFLYRLP